MVLLIDPDLLNLQDEHRWSVQVAVPEIPDARRSPVWRDSPDRIRTTNRSK
jgi:hypothetical protein